ncbi:MAG: M12 family metallo-peptidase [Planctomycetota bacterium JB042]
MRLPPIAFAALLFSLAPSAAAATTRERVAEALGTDRFALTELGPAVLPEGPEVELVVPGPHGDVALALAPHSLRSPKFRVLAVGADGPEEVAAPPVRTYRGVAYSSDSAEPAPCAASIVAGGVTALILLPDGDSRVIQPAADLVDGAPPAVHVVYDSGDAAAPDLRCATEALLGPPADGAPGGPIPVALEAAEIALEADLTFFDSNGTVDATVTNIETLMNAVTMIYEQDASITYLVTAIVVQTGPEETYPTNKPSKLLDQFRSHWNDTYGGLDRDTAHLLHGKPLNSNIAGLAYLGVICDEPFAYGWSRTTITGLFAYRVAITAHELGHNWNAEHCDGAADCEIMCATIGSFDGCTGGTSSFGTKATKQITKYLGKSGCVATLPDPLSPPFLDPCEKLKISNWLIQIGAKTTKKATGETSGAKSIGLDLGDDLRSNVIDLSSVAQARVELFVAARGPEEDEELLVEGLGNGGAWTELVRIGADGTPDDSFAYHGFDLPGSMLHDGFQLRLRPQVDEKNDDFYVDDVRVFDPGAGQLPSLRASSVSPLIATYPISTAGMPDPLPLPIRNDGRTTATLPWSAAEVVDESWLSLSPSSGNLLPSEDEDTVTVQLDPSGLPAFRHVGAVRLTNGADAGDTVDVPVALIVHVGAFVTPGDTLIGTIDAGDSDLFTFSGAAGEKLKLTSFPTTNGLKPRITVLDPVGALLTTIQFKGKKKEKKKITLPDDGLYIVEVAGKDEGQSGEYSFGTARKTPSHGKLDVSRRKPSTAGGALELPVLLRGGASLSVTVVPVDEGAGPFSIAVDDPDGAPIDVDAFLRTLPGGGVQLHRLPTVRPGTFTVHVTGFAAKEKVDVTIDPGAPPDGDATVELP